jgi:DNA-binding LacI/PurR family transcriptional regulator
MLFILSLYSTMDDNRLELCREFLQKAGTPKAVVTYSLHTAEPLLVAVLQLGLRVQGDLSIVTIGDNLHSPFGRTITTVALPAEEAGRRAVDVIIRKIANPDQYFPPIYIAPRLCVGSTTLSNL